LRVRRLAASQAALQAPFRRIHLGGQAASSTRSGGEEGGLMAVCRVEVHHRIPRCLLGFFDRAIEGDLDGEGLQAWIQWEEEAFRYGVDPELSRDELEALIESSASAVAGAAHRAAHSKADDFARWGRRGGSRTLALYGSGWFALLAKRRWEKISTEHLAEVFAALCEGRS